MTSLTARTLPPLAELTDVQIAGMAREAGEPAWLIERREAGWQHFVQAAPPFWRRTDLSRFKADVIAAPSDARATSLTYDQQLAERGVIVSTLAAAVRDHEPLVRQYLDSVVDPLTQKFTALHAALWQDGIF